MPVRGMFPENPIRLAGSWVFGKIPSLSSDLVVGTVRNVLTAVEADRCWALLPGENLFPLAWSALTWYTIAMGEAGGLVSCGLSNWS